MEKEVIEIPGVTDSSSRGGPPLSPVVRAGDFLFVSGMPPKDYETGNMISGDIATQTRKVLDNLRILHRREGATDPARRLQDCYLARDWVGGRFFPSGGS